MALNRDFLIALTLFLMARADRTQRHSSSTSSCIWLQKRNLRVHNLVSQLYPVISREKKASK